MAFSKTARAAIVHPNWGAANWQRFVEEHRKEMQGTGYNGLVRTASGAPNLVTRASEILQDQFSPERYLLTHATIVASVDTSDVPGIRTGTINELGRQINRKWANYRVKPACDIYINNNHDCWDRPVLLKSYRTFIGAHNFCFVPGTKIMMGDGTYRPIEELSIGDEVVTHKGRVRRITHVFERDYEGDIRSIKFDRFKDPVLVTGNHPFRSIEVSAPATKIRPGTKTSNAVRYRRDQIARGLRGERNVFNGDFSAEKGWRNAESLEEGSYVLGAERVAGDLQRTFEATLLGYYLAEGCPMGEKAGSDGFVLSFGPHEEALALDAKKCAEQLWPDARVTIRPTQTSLRVEIFASGSRDWCIRMGGHLAPHKRVDTSVFSWDQESLLRLLGAWMSGDGNLHKGTLRLRGTSTSRDLADQMQRVAEIVGVKSSVVFERRKIGEKTSTVSMVIGGENQSFEVINRHHVHTVLVSKESVSEIATRSARWPSLHVASSRKRSELAWWEDCRVHRVASNTSLPYEGKVYNIEVEEDHSYVIDNGIAVHNCEHVQIEEQSKGRIIDAAARDIGDSIYVDILIATDRRHASLIRDIESGRMGTMSMGCSVTETQCTKCGNVAADETEMCEHIKYAKGNYEYDSHGNKYRVAELCGHTTLDPTGGVTFIEASWVAVPAFQGAVMRNVLEPEVINVNTRSQMRDILASPPKEWTDDGMAKAARVVGRVSDRGAEMRRQAQLILSGEEAPDPMAPPPGDEGGAPDPMAPPPGGAPDPMGPPGGGMPGMPGAPGAEEKDPMEELEGDIKKYLLDKVKRELKKQMTEEVSEDAASDPQLATSTNENINKQAQLVAGTDALLRIARSDIELLDGLARLKASHGIKVSRDLYRTVLRVGSTDGHESLEKYLQRCAAVLTRQPTVGEAKTLVRLGRILSLRKKTRF